MTIGENILKLRKEKGLTQEELAEKLGVTFQAVSKWENDLACPDVSLLPEIADLFGISIDALLNHESKETINAAQTDNIPSENKLPWKDDNTYHVVLYKGQKRLDDCEIVEMNKTCELPELTINGDGWSVESVLSVMCGDVGGNAVAGMNLTCGDVGGSAAADRDIQCGDVEGNITAGRDVQCGDVGGNVFSGSSLKSGDVLDTLGKEGFLRAFRR